MRHIAPQQLEGSEYSEAQVGTKVGGQATKVWWGGSRKVSGVGTKTPANSGERRTFSGTERNATQKRARNKRQDVAGKT